MKLTLNKLTFERNFQAILNRLSFSLQDGELLQVRGANGSGKSTLLRVLAGYIEAPQETLMWNEQCISKQRELYQQQLHYVGHQNAIKPYLTVFENLQLNSAIAGKKISIEKVQSALNEIGLSVKLSTQAQYLSAGQQRRLCLTKLVLNPNPLWILDEPATALDAEGQQILLDLFRKHLDKGGMIIIATHHDLMMMRDIKTVRLGG